MDKAALVAADLAAGSTILEILDNSGFRINLAMWLHTPEYGDWRFVLSWRALESTTPSAGYGQVHDALEEAGFPLERTPPLLLLKTNDPFVRTLRRLFGKAKSVEGMRLGGQLVGDRFIDDAVVYRIA